MATVEDLKTLHDQLAQIFKSTFEGIHTTLTEQHVQQKDTIAALEDTLSAGPSSPFSKGPSGFSRAPLFKGEGENAQAFLDQFCLYAKLFQWTDTQKLQAFPLSLSGSAQTWYFTLDKTKYTTFDELTNLFKQHFLSSTDNWVLRQELGQRKQKPNESLADYAAFIRQRCLRLGIPKAEEMQYYIQGLEPKIREFVILQQPKTMEEAENAAKIRNSVKEPQVSALTMSDVLALQRNFVQELQRDGLLSQPTSSGNSNAYRQTSQVPQRPDNFGPRPPRQNSDPQNLRQIIREELRSFNSARSRPQYQFNDRGTFGRSTRTTNGDVICSYCKRVGHSYRNCRARNNQRNDFRPTQIPRERPDNRQFNPRNLPAQGARQPDRLN